jgi:hypothetical protein
MEPVPKLIDCALKRMVLDQALAVFQAKAKTSSNQKFATAGTIDA